MKRKVQGVRDLPPAPGELQLVHAFVNTADQQAGTDDLASPRALADWLSRHGLVPPGTELDAADLERALEVRECWRSQLAGSQNDQETAVVLDRAMAAALLRGRSGSGGVVRFEPAADGLDGALGRLLVIVAQAQSDGHWQRLKVCASQTCRAVFYDRSSNLSARWCRPRCGNRLSSKAYKRRTRRTRRVTRQGREARRRARLLSQEPYEAPSLAELEADPNVGDIARMLREAEEADSPES